MTPMERDKNGAENSVRVPPHQVCVTPAARRVRTSHQHSRDVIFEATPNRRMGGLPSAPRPSSHRQSRTIHTCVRHPSAPGARHQKPKEKTKTRLDELSVFLASETGGPVLKYSQVRVPTTRGVTTTPAYSSTLIHTRAPLTPSLARTPLKILQSTSKQQQLFGLFRPLQKEHRDLQLLRQNGGKKKRKEPRIDRIC